MRDILALGMFIPYYILRLAEDKKHYAENAFDIHVSARQIFMTYWGMFVHRKTGHANV